LRKEAIMAELTVAIYRLRFATDLTSAKAPTIDLGYMLESALDGSRFLGLVSRKALTADELRRVDTKTWPQLQELDAYMEELFRQAWDHVCEAQAEDCHLGSEFVARNRSLYSALSFELLPIEPFGLRLGGTVDEVHSSLYAKLHELAKQLQPALPQPKEALAPTPTTTRSKDEVLEFA
jgi:hypothetical protein